MCVKHATIVVKEFLLVGAYEKKQNSKCLLGFLVYLKQIKFHKILKGIDIFKY
jgi:hypothetical protein